MAERLIRHHIIQRTFWGANIEENFHRRTPEFEQAYHTVFPTLLPAERVESLLLLDASAYNPVVLKAMFDFNNKVKWLWISAYKRECFKPNNIFTDGK